MMDIHTIREMNAEAGEEAKEEGREPYVFSSIDIGNLRNGDTYPLRKIPRLGDYVPDGWQPVESYFVDSSGFGREDEPALTIPQFMRKVREGFGYAISEVGEFQIYIDEFVQKTELN